ncbi:hypothetical protein [Brevundimonas faecalis]|uniref:Uncharacterized protein n=1 Tax=Brevundimonas faecalis TaxID=947378 RepID=A0ABV2R7I4_9CAUL
MKYRDTAFFSPVFLLGLNGITIALCELSAFLGKDQQFFYAVARGDAGQRGSERLQKVRTFVRSYWAGAVEARRPRRKGADPTSFFAEQARSEQPIDAEQQLQRLIGARHQEYEKGIHTQSSTMGRGAGQVTTSSFPCDVSAP